MAVAVACAPALGDALVQAHAGPARCDPIDPAVCMLPFPNDYFTVPDPSTDTHRRVAFDLTSMPTNKAGKPIDPSDLNRGDGFSPDGPIVTKVPGLDKPAALEAQGIVGLKDLSKYAAADQKVVVINTATHQRQLIWAEIDSNPPNAADRVLVIHPAKNLPEGTRFIVALRNIDDDNGAPVPSSPAFASYRDGTAPATDPRKAHFDAIFHELRSAGIERSSLFLAWDFTTASERSLSQRQLSIRDAAFAALGEPASHLTNARHEVRPPEGHAPAFTVDKVTDYTPSENSNIARRVDGTFQVPCYLNLPGCPSGSRFVYSPLDPTGGPPVAIPGNTETAYYQCNIPRRALDGGSTEKERPSLYGHGLFGSRGEVNQWQAQAMDQEHGFMYCATDWVGMACTNLPDTPGSPSNPTSFFNQLVTTAQDPRTAYRPDCDIPVALSDEADLSGFPTLVDRVDQAFVNFMYLGRLMIHGQGFSSNPAFQDSSGQSVIDTSRLFYDGNSQGGIFGGALIALEPDLDRGVVGVPGQSYSILLQRSSDFGTGTPPNFNPTDPTSAIPQYAYPLYTAYPNQLERQLILGLMQQMWDHSDPAGLSLHMTSDPLPNTPAHHVLMTLALGDHQVSNYAAEAEGRTIGAAARAPWADVGRALDVPANDGTPPFGLPAIGSYPYDGSAITIWDSGPESTTNCAGRDTSGGVCGTNPDPIENIPPSSGQDPHEAVRRSAEDRTMKSEFMRIGGVVTDQCGARPCYDFGWTGP